MRWLDDWWAGPFKFRRPTEHRAPAVSLGELDDRLLHRRDPPYRIDGLHAAAIAAVVSLLLYLPVYLVFFGNGLFSVPVSELVFQALYQGVLTAAISLALYGRAIHLLGASNAAAFVALGPSWPPDGDSGARRVAAA